MRLIASTVLSARYKILLVGLSLVGVVLVLLSTSLHGAGLSYDSVGYIATARNIAAGIGVVTYDGTPLVVQPPLYPMVLAITDFGFKIDPLTSASVVNAVIFGLIVYFAGLLLSRHLTSSVVFSLLGATVVLFSPALQRIAVMAWSEPLFIFLVLVFLVFLERFLAKKDTTSFVIFSLSAALACLTRYIGVTLIASGILALLLLRRDDLQAKVASAILFLVISAMPLGMWAIRNYAVSGLLFGPHTSSVYTLPQNLDLTFNTLLGWYVPGRISEHHFVFALLGASVGFLAGFTVKDNLTKLKTALSQIGTVALFVAIYTLFLIFSSTIIAYDPIGDRLLSPIWIPATILLLALAENLLEPFRERFSPQNVNVLLVAGIAMWLLVYPFMNTASDTINRMRQGAGGYNTNTWKNSALISYLQRHPLETGHKIYSNAPDALYILANITGQMSPAKTAYNSNDKRNEIETLGRTWPKGSNGYLVWFEPNWRGYLYTIDELRNIANMQLIIQSSDGVIYRVQRMP